ncbi:MAG: ATP-dependent RNA helicase HrpA [Betaproteobacteria bacterium]|nr:ATP-dependent RNA helicase HrpA [Betaproteobacteria bacterium]MDE2123889.1 ATP-dependent RNA helicase HrpA [Betaproteobacteria bacterium]MDE2186037.1 ATP-dependent RNA helicase HrpA [Betaproteobacteria bacterium]
MLCQALMLPKPRLVNLIPPLRFPAELPVSGRRDDIAAAIAAHQVVIVCGETGSGKTTQLPKIALALGRGLGAGGRGLIGHTQPRRLAAVTVARRIAQELGSPLGEHVGYKVRFADRFQPGASVKLMTDGILLAETQGDPLLRAYDTLIIDEAHERSLNIDFLLGHIRNILPHRPDLKVVITSATIDAERFARHFEASPGPIPGRPEPGEALLEGCGAAQSGARGPSVPAPVIEVSGRLYPVDIRWRPYGVDVQARAGAPAAAELAPRAQAQREERDLHAAICDAVDELWREGSGDILVFLPGEREIRDATEALRKHHLDTARRGVDILPLYARLSQAEQDRVFQSGGARRVVLATNVAETSLTVPGIRYVIDAGNARVKRYSYRQKVEQLQVEPVSQAAANQRAGRCGRMANGICIRLYDEADFNARPRFTDPEILRSSLAAVILRMQALGLEGVEQFPFIDPPPRKAIADGYQLLVELGAVDAQNQLTEVGRELARLPLDPRLGRMVLEARRLGALQEVLIIAAALAVQDPRERPADKQEAADTAHRRFVEGTSELAGWLKLWAHYHALVAHKKSNRKLHDQLRAEFLSPMRMREWHDIHSQLLTVAAEQGWRVDPSQAPGRPKAALSPKLDLSPRGAGTARGDLGAIPALAASDENIHLSLLAGLLGNVGCKADDGPHYLGARGIKFLIHPSSPIGRKAGRWVMAAELVETTRLYARGVARIEPSWIERVGAHLLQKTLLEPHWEKTPAQVVAFERATLYGLVVYNQRRIDFGRVNPAQARELFVRHALVEGEWDCRWPFFAHNRKLITQVEALEDKARRRDVLVDEALIEAFYERFIPADVFGGTSFDTWYRQASKAQPRLLFLEREALMRHEAAGITTEAFPMRLRIGALELQLAYSFDPGGTRDGVTATVPLAALNQIPEQRLAWLVPGMLADKLTALLKSLPQKLRSRLVPLPDTVRRFAATLSTPERYAQGELLDAVRALVREHTGLIPRPEDFKLDTLGPHVLFNLRVIDPQGRQLGMSRNLSRLRVDLADAARTAFQDAVRSQSAQDVELDSANGLDAPPMALAESRTHPRDIRPAEARAPASAQAEPRYTEWTFGELPELLEMRRGQQILVGFPALIDRGDHVQFDVFDTPEAASRAHREGLRRLFALQLREPLKAAEKNLPGFQQAAMQYMPLGSADDLRRQIQDAALDLAFLADPLPANAASFAERLAAGRPRLQLLVQDMGRLAATILAEWHAASKKLVAFKPQATLHADIIAQLQALLPKRFMLELPASRRAHLPRYLKAVQLRLDKFRADPARDTQRQAEMAPVLARLRRELQQAQQGGASPDPRLVELRWMLEELRVALFAQELRTPTPVSVKRVEKAWDQWRA